MVFMGSLDGSSLAKRVFNSIFERGNNQFQGHRTLNASLKDKPQND